MKKFKNAKTTDPSIHSASPKLRRTLRASGRLKSLFAKPENILSDASLGFTLIEIVIGIMLSSIVSLVLYNMLNQTTRVVENVTSYTNLDNKIAVLYNQIDKTISAAFLPRIEEVRSTLSTETVTVIKTNKTGKPENKEEKKQKVEKIFYSENDGANLKLLTFLSTGAVRGYDESGGNITRVVYRLVKDEQNPGFFKLLIQQNSKFLDLDILKPENSKTRSYELATGIKSLKAVYYAREEKQEGEKNITRTKLPDWGSKEMLEKYKQKLPEFVDLNGVIWDDVKKRNTEIKFKFNIYGYVAPETNKPKEDKNKAVPAERIQPSTGKQPATPAPKITAQPDPKLDEIKKIAADNPNIFG